MRWVEEIARCVAEGQENGEIMTRFSPRKIAEFLHAGSYGAFARMKATRSKQYLEDWYAMSFAFIQNSGA
jgi:TetR/AcrR family transcriptional repressor of nem operon